MNVAMLTNVYLPHVGGVARSVETFKGALEALGDEVLIVAPEYEGAEDAEDVIRIPAIQNFNGSDFSVRLPVPGLLSDALDHFEPDLVHAHHPFLLGDTALRVASSRGLPLVFTHHTMYERYTHYVPGDSDAMKAFAVRLSTEYANLCDLVVAPSESVAAMLRERGVESPVEVVPTGVDVEHFRSGDGARIRRRAGIPEGMTVIGHLGRLAPEKNLEFLARAVGDAVAGRHEATCFLVVGDGPSREALEGAFADRGIAHRLHATGALEGDDLVDAYHAMDFFVFASKTETQGMVLTEAMAAGLPVVALDAPGAREVVKDGGNGILLPGDSGTDAFREAVLRLVDLDVQERSRMSASAERTADEFSVERCTRKLRELYGALEEPGSASRWAEDDGPWAQAVRRLEAEWDLWSRRTSAAVDVITGQGQDAEGDGRSGSRPPPV